MSYCVYIMASKRHGTLYIGMASDLPKRVYEHKNNLVEGFTKRYSCHTLVYFEPIEDFDSALQRKTNESLESTMENRTN